MTPTSKRLLTPPALLLSAIALAACGHDESGAASTLAADAAHAPSVASSAQRDVTSRQDAMQRQVVSTGSVELNGRHLDRQRAGVDRIVRRHGGTVADETSTGGRDGRPSRIQLVVRVPSADFVASMDALEAVPGVRDSQRSSEDVTTQVIDVAQRVKAQRVGLTRVEGLLGRAGSLDEVVRLEQEITRRQADLDSLVQQQAYLADQTSLSTITITLERSAPPAPAGRPAGFVGGLEHGWHAFSLTVVGTLTGVGAVLPFAVVIVLVGAPVWLAIRRRSASTPARTP